MSMALTKHISSDTPLIQTAGRPFQTCQSLPNAPQPESMAKCSISRILSLDQYLPTTQTTSNLAG